MYEANSPFWWGFSSPVLSVCDYSPSNFHAPLHRQDARRRVKKRTPRVGNLARKVRRLQKEWIFRAKQEQQRNDWEQQRNNWEQQWNGQQQLKNSFVNTSGRVAESSSHASRSPTIAGDVQTTIRLIPKTLTAALRSTQSATPLLATPRLRGSGTLMASPRQKTILSALHLLHRNLDYNLGRAGEGQKMRRHVAVSLVTSSTHLPFC